MSRNTAIQISRKWLEQAPLYLDTETTGLEYGDEIVEIAIIDDAGEPLLNSLVKPVDAIISAGAFRVHGISRPMLETAPTLADLWPKICQVASGRLVLIYNEGFDRQMLHNSLRANGMNPDLIPFSTDCAMMAYAEFYGDWNDYYHSYRWQKLDAACRQCGIKQPQDHRALGDTQLTRLVVHTMAATTLTAEDETEAEYPF